MIDQFVNDLRFGMRTLVKNRGFALLAILTLGLGIGANTAIFSVIYGVLLRPLPYTDSDRLVLIRQSAPLAGRADVGVSIKEYFTYRDQATDFDGLVEFHQMNFDLLKRGELLSVPAKGSVSTVMRTGFVAQARGPWPEKAS